MVSILLVHGTFAVNAAWTNDGSAVREAINRAVVESGQSVRFVPIIWSGKNWFSDRLAAARAISSKVQEEHRKDQKIFIIGHSHGGSATSYFLKLFPNEARLVDGCVFLSTPFITFKARPNIDRRVRNWAYLFWLTAQVTVLLGLMHLSAGLGEQDLAFYAAVVSNILFGLLLWRSLHSPDFFKGVIARANADMTRIMRERDSCELPDKEYLLLKFSGDEASFGLSSAQSISYAVNQLLDKFSSVISRLRNAAAGNSLIGPEGLELMVIAPVLGWLAFSPLIASYGLTFDKLSKPDELSINVAEKERHDQTRLMIDFFSSHPWVFDEVSKRMGQKSYSGPRPNAEQVRKDTDTAEQMSKTSSKLSREIEKLQADQWRFYVVRELKRIFAATLFGLFVLGALSILILFSLMSFGSLGLVELLFMETSVEATPHGNHMLVHLDWRRESKPSKELRHSQVYTSADSIEIISRWIKSKVCQSLKSDG